ncbi:2-succinyl-6-hydroxy-2,4-cyclohexadiene-1-carboxy late synthase [Haloferula helveola]|uniref:2-succinyl-6-hydroxy-2,4-cyclohexadiene-1-carboxy late synthase n=1 Tax=Haloferula helveola TaxID=490095 RepID=A0ABN6H0I3_9BACT|nr:2-succinyl-6-hydroxy-2,4-cyclohexadiene-1-carboxy late synthase [Haloferula helveola]
MLGTIWCLHGAVGMAEDWRDFSVPGWAVKRVDLWRFLDCCPMDLAEFGAALNREAEATQGRKVLLGYSMGGRLALHALLAGRDERPRSSESAIGGNGPRTSGGARPYRGSWDAAVIVSAHPGLEDETQRAERREKDAEWAAKALKGEWSEFLAEWNAQAVLATSDAELKMGDRGKLEVRRNSVARSFMDWSLGAQAPLWNRLGRIACPVLWVAGERDTKFRELAERVASAGAGRSGHGLERDAPATLWIAPGAGHRVPWESGIFASKVGEFLERRLS